MDALKNIGITPVTYSVLESIFTELSYPSDKIEELENEGTLIRLKKGVYVVSPNVSGELLSVELIANHLYGPSYVSMESALRYYGLIPEEVYTVKSIITARARTYSNSISTFEYIAVPEAYYPIGITQKKVGGEGTFLIATPEKALCDQIMLTPRLRIQSKSAMKEYLVKDLRFEMESLRDFNGEIVELCIKSGRKRKSLESLLKLI